MFSVFLSIPQQQHIKTPPRKEKRWLQICDTVLFFFFFFFLILFLNCKVPVLLPGVDVNICNEERESVTRQIPCMKLLLIINEACALALSTYTFPYVHMYTLICICTYTYKITYPNKQNYLSKYIQDKGTTSI